MAQLLLQGLITNANDTQSWFIDNADPTKVRSYNAFPIDRNLPYDPQAEIVEVFHLLKHGSGELQANVIVLNKVGGPWGPNAGGPTLAYQVWVAES